MDSSKAQRTYLDNQTIVFFTTSDLLFSMTFKQSSQANCPLFIGGAPRSGTSLLSVITGSLPNVSVVQDSGIFFYLKQAAVLTHLCLNQTQNPWAHVNGIIYGFDLRQTQFFPDFLGSSPFETLNQARKGISGSLLRTYIACLDTFWFEMYNLPDPRKDRQKGTSFMSCIDTQSLLASADMALAIRNLHDMLHSNSSGNHLGAQNFSALPSSEIIKCEKTPENILCLDLFDLLYPEGYKFLGIVRDPVAVYGARRQRCDRGVDDFILFYKCYCLPTLKGDACRGELYIRYEDLIRNPLEQLQRLHSFVNPSCVDLEIDLNSLNPGSYISYVGSQIDPGRDRANRENVTLSEAAKIREQLAPFYEKFGYQ